MSRLKKEKIKNKSGFDLNLDGKFPYLRDKYVRIVKKSVGGDAPKAIIRLYTYGIGTIDNPKSWPTYIAKVGQKWYPIESITEQLFTDLGELFCVNIAESHLAIGSNQLRFLSNIFLGKDDRLVHGAEIYAHYFKDLDFIKKVEESKLSKELFTFTFTLEVIEDLYPNQFNEIIPSFIRMIAFDALTGNTDRHFYNWGIIENIKGVYEPKFSPIYDTARGLFWAYKEEKLKNIATSHKNILKHIVNYSNGSKPKIGAEDNPDLNHFQFIEFLNENYPEYTFIIKNVISNYSKEDIQELLFTKYRYLLSDLRKQFIVECLEYRKNKLVSLLK